RGLVIDALARHPDAAAPLFECFAARFSGRADTAPLRQRFLESLETVESLRDDVTLRALCDTVEATVRSNYFATPVAETLAFKIRSSGLAHLPRPRPLYEIYVHGPAVEGIHLRAGLVARGGIRHSDRPEDFRTEVLGLMKTQTVKNAVIVPVGAKGGFVVRRGTPADAYRTFVGALLDLTDNVVAGRVVPPRGLVFGNGLLRSSHLRLQAAFNHRHVFLDPDPDPTASFAERERLYRAGLGWDAYDPAALSPGGAVVARTAKRVVLSPEAQRLL